MRHQLFEEASVSRHEGVAASGDIGYTGGSNHYNKTTPKGLVDSSEKWVTIYKKIDGKWKAILDIANSDKSVSGQ